jgi:hypothetical protein
MAGERHRVGDSGRAGADHHAIQGKLGVAVGVHHLFSFIERERGRLAGGAEHIEPVAAVVDQKARELGGAGDVGRAVFVDRCGDGGDHAAQFRFGHGISSEFVALRLSARIFRRQQATGGTPA